jgi:hypothetical protein
MGDAHFSGKLLFRMSATHFVMENDALAIRGTFKKRPGEGVGVG